MNKRIVWMTALACELASDFFHEVAVDLYQPTPKPVRRRRPKPRVRVLPLPVER